MWKLVVVLCVVQTSLGCVREPREEHSTALRSPGDNGFRIQISGEPERYVPGAVYTLSIVGSRTHGRLQQFTRFMLGVEPVDPQLGAVVGVDASPQRVGSFQLFGDSLTTFNEFCINTISEADDLPKTEVQVMWIAPAKGSGCVIFRAMVLEDGDNWYADDGDLSRQLCELVETQKGKSGDDDGECCACDEAKYQLIFEGIWSNRTHPRDFPFSLWLTHFSDVIGASHERNFSFWGEGQYSSDGLRQVAEWGSVRGMEAELRAESKHLRTLIKAAGLWYPRVNSNTTSSFRVDQRHPLVSLVSMLGPTPDWIVGVSGLNLCNRDCTWADQKILDLFPWDAGTDSGITYMSPNSPTVPQEKIHRITTMYPEDPRAPFYDPTGKPMKPLARLYLTRESVIPKSCDEQSLNRILEESLQVAENTEDSSRPECAVTEYSDWSPCSVSCGKGLRMRRRFYRNEAKATMLGCDRQLVSKEMCVAEIPECPGGDGIAIPAANGDEQILEDNEGMCATTPWGLWSECSASCGEGIMIRSRKFLERLGRKKCPHVTITERKPCSQPECGLEEPTREIVDPMCPATEWSDWSPCSASCGKGVKLRTRLLLVAPELQQKCSMRVELVQQRHCIVQEDCTIDMAQAKEICMMEQEIGPCRGYFERWYFEARKGMCVPFGYGGCRGNRNNFLTAKECNDACGLIRDQLLQQLDFPQQQEKIKQAPVAPPVDCRVSDWSVWTECSVTCGVGIRERFRTIEVKAENGGRACPRRLVRRKKCQISPCAKSQILLPGDTTWRRTTLSPGKK
ncbi:hypothetical protein L9F63_022355 [Diploptera punctata]|uniref:Spondin-1 n=1 Tax=Diploptera punctata TaxID=6984 RepID=A0AAD8EAX2_DIPPU|nr:hypothetical protein L9F63_022355 [Diploptera punctata]